MATVFMFCDLNMKCICMLDLSICMFHVLRLPEFQGFDKRGLVTTVVFCDHTKHTICCNSPNSTKSRPEDQCITLDGY